MIGATFAGARSTPVGLCGPICEPGGGFVAAVARSGGRVLYRG